jgi:DNA-binding GntR family transcriptional regulator
MTQDGDAKKNRLQHFSLRQQVAAILRKDILRGKYLPGDRIVEAEIATNLNISRGPVREAIRQLEEEGLVTYSNNKGCSVTTLDPQDAWEIYLLRADLESLALNLCNGKVGEKTLEEMEICIKGMEEAAKSDDLADMVEQDHRFHSLICRAPGNKRLYKLWSSLNNTSYAIFLTVISANIGSLEGMAAKHRKVLDTLRSSNRETACQGIKDHYLGTGRELFLKNGGDQPQWEYPSNINGTWR